MNNESKTQDMPAGTGGTESAALPRVCLLLESYAPVTGGMETQAVNLLRALRARGVKCMIVTRRSEKTLPRFEETAEGTVHRVLPSARAPMSRWLLALTTLPVLVRLRREYDLILVGGFRTLGFTAILMKRLFGKPAILKAESSGELSGAFFQGGMKKMKISPDGALARFFLRRRAKSLAKADAFISLSSVMTEEFTEHGVPRERVHEIPNMVDTERFRAATAAEKRALRDKLGLPRDAIVMIFVGRLVTYKGLPTLLDAWANIVSRKGLMKLIIVGSGGTDIYNCEDETRERVRGEAWADSVVFTGDIPNVNEYLQASDIFLFPSENEALPVCLIEAMACQLPAVTCPAGGVVDVIRNGENGLIVPFQSSGQLADSVGRLLEAPALRERIAKAAWKTVQERYTPEGVARQYVELLRTLNPANQNA